MLLKKQFAFKEKEKVMQDTDHCMYCTSRMHISLSAVIWHTFIVRFWGKEQKAEKNNRTLSTTGNRVKGEGKHQKEKRT